jgi:hypothetical protein
MAKYCKKCLKRINDNQELCQECYNKEHASSSGQFCKRCGKPVSVITVMLSKKDNILCMECISKDADRREYEKRKAEEARQQKIQDEKTDRLRKGFSCIVINRVSTLANAALNMKVYVRNLRNGETITYDLRNGESKEISVIGNFEYTINAKISGWKESKPLSVFVDRSENVYVDISSKASGSALGLIAYKALGEDMIFCDIVKREILENDKLRVINAAK